MREWRKVHRSLTSSERIAQVSYPARWLYTLLLVNQDDEGSYPWTATMIRSITVTTEWTVIEASTYLEELKSQGLVDQQAHRVAIRRGVEFNGNPKSNSRKPLVYPESDISPTTVGLESDISPARGEEKERRERLEEDETAASSEAASLSEPENQSTWPEWFSLGHGLKGWVISLDTADAWRITGGYSNEYCLDQVYKVRGWWTKKHEKDGRNPYSTFQQACRENWAKSPPEGGANNGIHPTSPGLAALAKYGSSNPVT